MYDIILLNNDETSFDFVIKLLTEIFSITSEEAENIALKVEHKGSYVCGTYNYQVAKSIIEEINIIINKFNEPLVFELKENEIYKHIVDRLYIDDYSIDEEPWGCSPHFLLRHQKSDYNKVKGYGESYEEQQRKYSKSPSPIDLFYEGLMTTKYFIKKDLSYLKGSLLYSDNQYLKKFYSTTLYNLDNIEVVARKGGVPSIHIEDKFKDKHILYFSSERIFEINNSICYIFTIYNTLLNRIGIVKDNYIYSKHFPKNYSSKDILYTNIVNFLSLISQSSYAEYSKQEELIYPYLPKELVCAIDGARRFYIYHELGHIFKAHNDKAVGRHSSGISEFSFLAFNDYEIKELQADRIAINILLGQFLNDLHDIFSNDFYGDTFYWEILGICIFIFSQYFTLIGKYDNYNFFKTVVYGYIPSFYENIGEALKLLDPMKKIDYYLLRDDKPIGVESIIQSTLSHPSPGTRINHILISVIASIYERLDSKSIKTDSPAISIFLLILKIKKIIDFLKESLLTLIESKYYIKWLKENSKHDDENNTIKNVLLASSDIAVSLKKIYAFENLSDGFIESEETLHRALNQLKKDLYAFKKGSYEFHNLNILNILDEFKNFKSI